jgi:hypothetical protein
MNMGPLDPELMRAELLRTLQNIDAIKGSDPEPERPPLPAPPRLRLIQGGKSNG